MDELSRAVILISVSYLKSDAVLTAEFADAFGTAADEWRARARAVQSETFTVPVDWDGGGLGELRDVVRAEIARRHPELSAEAADAIADYWAFCNR
ncbi:hypothetical protein [Actinacidiphila rubida]|uniref:Uncharacterized protein n=1 Tax=Actinacidiphila rubida TaxID=310780 RepID=A0A1H8HR91_9ACTN|nr:hypothetical protein [Actinacidiphila rubida]SEN58456.1 hypothetical protein SAMN05216267_10076 [Actinacidiphila rubida]